MRLHFARLSALFVTTVLLGACAKGDRATADSTGTTTAANAPRETCTGDNGGLTLPTGFCATVFADGLGHARHMAVASNGDVYVNTWSGAYYGNAKPPAGGFVVALRDSNRDGRADQIVRFGGTPAGGAKGGTGIALYGGYVYAEEGNRIVRFPLPSGSLAGDSAFSTIVRGLPTTGDHPIFPFVIDTAGTLYMNSGSATNSCQARNRVAGVPGRNPCTELATRAGIWSFDARQTNQIFSASQRFATGIRNAVGITIGPDGALYTTQHGRDQLAENWPKLYTPEQGQNLPA
jgi:glucose/arabinose dehydrogenase